jgi:tRNA nucleotidyltransferase (CCA-adding enzyme)
MPELPKMDLAAALWRSYPELEALRNLAKQPVYVVGGAVRDLLLGERRADLDVVVEGDPMTLAAKLGAEVVSHERFSTAKVRPLDGHEIDIAAARVESYPEPGALPEVAPAPGIEADLGRRDFTVNAMAISLAESPELIDPHDGRLDLERRTLRVLHPGSFVDDPTRALRAARYAARLGFELEAETDELLRATDLSTVSGDRREADLLRLAAEPNAARGFELLAEWGLVPLRPDGIELAQRVGALLVEPPWSEAVPRAQAVLAAALGPAGNEHELAAAAPEMPSEAVDLAGGCDPVALALARALGAEWLDRYLLEWRSVGLEIDGEDLMVAGIPQGPAVGEGLAAALRDKLDGKIDGREQELETALLAARSTDGMA